MGVLDIPAPKLEDWHAFDQLPMFQSIPILWILVILAGIVIEVGIKGQVLNYCWFYAPKDRPLNIMISIDQVQS